MNGFFLIDKETGISSAACVSKLKYSLINHAKIASPKLGHTGTLDPDATGLLVICLGKATKLSSIITDGFKCYEGEIQLGITTTSDDLSGETIANSAAIPTLCQKDLDQLANQFIGIQDQRPPNVSAVKIKGVRAYKLVNQGVIPDIKERKINIRSLTLRQLSRDRLSYELHCGKGTYVRSLARDLGSLIGCGAAVASIRRNKISPFEVKAAKKLSKTSIDDLIPWQQPFAEYPKIVLNPEELKLSLQGNKDQLAKLDESFNSLSNQTPQLLISDQSHPLGIMFMGSNGINRIWC